MNAAALTLSQTRYANKAYWRNPALAFFAFVYPLMFLVIFTSIFRSSNVPYGAVRVNEATYYLPGMMVLAVITVCFNNVAVAISIQRDSGVLKRIDGTPLPRGSFFGARILHAVLVSGLLVIITATFGRAFYNADIPTGVALLDALAMLAVGAASFCALGFAIASVVPNADASLPIVNVVILPLLFVSGVFIPLGNNPPFWMLWVGRIFPIQHFLAGMQAGFLGGAFSWVDVAVVAAWGVGGLLFAVRFFRWEPSAG
ncbi:MAG: ABC transporter permease [Candidatus Dormibacteria bacterium]|jgi:ABC-2 type transport system permease protein